MLTDKPPPYIATITEDTVIVVDEREVFQGADFGFQNMEGGWYKHVDASDLDKLADIIFELSITGLLFSGGPDWSPAQMAKELKVRFGNKFHAKYISWLNKSTWVIDDI